MKDNLVFCSIIFPGAQFETDSLLLAESIRAFGGRYAGRPLWFAVPETGEHLSEYAGKRLRELDVRLFSFPVDMNPPRLFFAEQLTALSLMEAAADGECECLTWMDANTLMLNEPPELFLSPHAFLGYRPVHHRLIGSRYDIPPDSFWSLIYQHCRVDPARIFPMQPVVEDVRMRPYFNAGLLVVRPQRGLLRQWRHVFDTLGHAPDFQSFYIEDARYAIFMHQAVLSGVLLRELEWQEMIELPETYNYPLHLHGQDATTRRPQSIDSLITVRHEGFYNQNDWQERLPVGAALKRWLAEKLREIHI